ncbi:TetR/AcrR family transcriptional regulator [Phyllobacterium sp. OV277]|uniref:TetR/AcrR family transcriptional regulator n=1 Tax=Phyllobacterium sp. OV277 TaxID=1882772 RepID=UPI000881E590|nr:TetR/AcrR family transcriptional regulator [Phyllobacterium sp. OV277]SDP52526.1 transcriptional regulator, TetR family [Phyllobacterium sp. OV277]
MAEIKEASSAEVAATAPGVRARRKAQRPQEILHAAFDEFVERGYTATRIEDVANRAGVTKGTIYLYFQNKEELFQDVVRKLSQPIFNEEQFWQEHQKRPSDELVRLYLDTVYEHMTVNPYSREILRFLISDGRSFPELTASHYEEFVRPILTMLQHILKKGVREGIFRPEAAASQMSYILLSPALTLTIDKLLDCQTDLPELGDYVNAHYEMIMRNVRN